MDEIFEARRKEREGVINFAIGVCIGAFGMWALIGYELWRDDWEPSKLKEAADRLDRMAGEGKRERA